MEGGCYPQLEALAIFSDDEETLGSTSPMSGSGSIQLKSHITLAPGLRFMRNIPLHGSMIQMFRAHIKEAGLKVNSPLGIMICLT